MTDQSTAVVTLSERQPRSVLVDMSGRYGMEPAAFEATLRATVCKGNISREEFAAFLLVAKEYNLNPVTKELYAFPAKGGGIQPIVSIDGWARIINDHPMFDGMEFEDVRDGDELTAITCRMHRKDRSRSIEATEYMAECRRTTDVWKTWPRRMLRHKAMIQCARYAFGFSGIVEQDEYERQMGVRDVTPREAPNLAARLAGPSEAATEGFTVHNTLDPDDHITDFSQDPPKPADDDFPGDPSGEGAAESPEPNGDEEKGSADVLTWQRRLVEDMDGLSLEQLDHLLANPSDIEMFEELERDQPQLAMDLNKAITRRRKELA